MTKQDAMKKAQCEGLTPAEALLNLGRAKERVKGARSDFGYWDAQSVFCNALVQATIAVSPEGAELPNFPKEGGVLMDAQANLIKWCADALGDHEHSYVPCTHNVKEGSTHPKCTSSAGYGLYHDVCETCGRGKYETKDVEEEIVRRATQ